MKIIFFNFLIVSFIISSCEVDDKNYFPFSVGTKWLYSITISSSYTGKEYDKRLMVTNVSSEKKNNIIQISKLHSDGSYYTYKINKKTAEITRSSVVLAFSDGMVEPIKKIIYPDINFGIDEWIIKEQLFLLKGFQPPLLNVKPRSQFDMRYKIVDRFDSLKLNGKKLQTLYRNRRSGKNEFYWRY